MIKAAQETLDRLKSVAYKEKRADDAELNAGRPYTAGHAMAVVTPRTPILERTISTVQCGRSWLQTILLCHNGRNVGIVVPFNLRHGREGYRHVLRQSIA